MQVEAIVFRFDKEDAAAPVFQTYLVPFTRGMTVLDVLALIQTAYDPTLAFRWECEAAICGTCTVNVNGKPVLACEAVVDPEKPLIISPIGNFAVQKDMVVELQSGLARLALAKPYLAFNGKTIATQEAADASRKLRTCIECWACVSVCPVARDYPQEAADPLGMVKLARYHLDPRDELQRPSLATENGLARYACETCQLCVDVCPKAINVPEEAIYLLREEVKDES